MTIPKVSDERLAEMIAWNDWMLKRMPFKSEPRYRDTAALLRELQQLRSSLRIHEHMEEGGSQSNSRGE